MKKKKNSLLDIVSIEKYGLAISIASLAWIISISLKLVIMNI